MRLLSLWFLLALCGQVVGQRVVWEKRIGWRDDDFLSDVVSLQDGTSLACGLSSTYQDTIGLIQFAGIMLLRITEQGDTIYCRPSGLYGYNPRLCRMASGDVFLGAYAYDLTSELTILFQVR